MATTPRKLIKGALRLLNVIQSGEEPSADDTDICLESLNQMIDSWSTYSLMIFSYVPETFNLIGGVQNYTVGPGGDWDTEEPIRIQQMYLEWQSGNPVSIEITQLNDAQWASIAVKNTTSTMPRMFYSDGAHPLNTFSFWPIPTVSSPVTVWFWKPLATYNTLDNDITLPPGYERAIKYNLAMEVAPEFSKQPAPSVQDIAMKSLAVLKALNAIPQEMSCPSGITGGTLSSFNWLTGS